MWKRTGASKTGKNRRSYGNEPKQNKQIIKVFLVMTWVLFQSQCQAGRLKVSQSSVSIQVRHVSPIIDSSFLSLVLESSVSIQVRHVTHSYTMALIVFVIGFTNKYITSGWPSRHPFLIIYHRLADTLDWLTERVSLFLDNSIFPKVLTPSL